MKTVFTITYEHPIHKVFPYLAEPERWLEYVPALIERTKIGDGPVGPGTKWRSIDRVGPLKVEFTDELVELEPNSRVVFRQSSPWNSLVEYRVEADGDRTVLHVHWEGKLEGKIWWLDLMPDSWATKVFMTEMKRIGDVLDAGSAT